MSDFKTSPRLHIARRRQGMMVFKSRGRFLALVELRGATVVTMFGRLAHGIAAGPFGGAVLLFRLGILNANELECVPIAACNQTGLERIYREDRTSCRLHIPSIVDHADVILKQNAADTWVLRLKAISSAGNMKPIVGGDRYVGKRHVHVTMEPHLGVANGVSLRHDGDWVPRASCEGGGGVWRGLQGEARGGGSAGAVLQGRQRDLQGKQRDLQGRRRDLQRSQEDLQGRRREL